MRESRTCGSVRGARDETRVPTAPGVDGPLAASRCQNAGWSETNGEEGAIHERNYDDRVRLGEACFPGNTGQNDGPSPRGCRRNFISAGVQPAAEVLLG